VRNENLGLQILPLIDIFEFLQMCNNRIKGTYFSTSVNLEFFLPKIGSG
jgi:hypothetical protein